MNALEQQVYVPVLRMKKGEYRGLASLQRSVAARILPHLVVPPPDEPDRDLGRELSDEEVISLAGARLGEFWYRKPALVDVRFLLPKIKSLDPGVWLPDLFARAAKNHGWPIPVATLRDLEGSYFDGFAGAVKIADGQLALRLTLSNLGDDDLAIRVQRALLKIGLKPQQCVLILDFSDADFSDKEIVADQYQLYFDQLIEIGLWDRIVFEGTTFPQKNPAPVAGVSLFDRSDWLAWKIAAGANDVFKQHSMFGDFGADSALFRFGKSAVKAIRHYRYSTSDHWFVVRAGASGTDSMLMRDVSKRIVESRHYAGRDFSLGDEFIDNCAYTGERPGNSTTWREVNTCHHLSQVICDLSKIHSFEYERRRVAPRSEQMPLFAL